MAWKAQGYSHDDIRDGFDIIRACKTSDELRTAIDEQPILRTSAFHQFLRNVVAQIRAEKAADPLVRWYDEFFLILHRRIHAECLQRGLERPIESTTAQPPLMPEYLRALISNCAGRIPDPVAIPRHPERDKRQIEADVAAMQVECTELPPYESTPAMRWSVLVVDCPRCKQASLVAHAHLVDLVAAPHLKDALCAGQVNAHRCFQCAHAGFMPRFTWIRDSTGSMDELSDAATIWRLDAETTIYQAPPGTIEIRNNDDVFEVRCDNLWQHTANDEFSTERDRRQRTFILIYENARLLEFIKERNTPNPMPAEMYALVSTLGRHLASGAMAPHFAEHYAAKAIAEGDTIGTWPLFMIPHSLASDPYEHLAHCVVTEVVARARREEPALHAIFAGQTSQAFHAIGELGLFEQAHTRAQDACNEIPPGSERAQLETDLEESRAALAVKLADHTAAAAIRQTRIHALSAAESFIHRAYRAQVNASLGLNLMRSNKLADAFSTFQNETATLEKLIQEASDSTDEIERRHIEPLTNSLSGALANWSTLLEELADALDAFQYANHEYNAGLIQIPQHRESALLRTLRSMSPERLTAVEHATPLLTKCIATCIIGDPSLCNTVPSTLADLVMVTKTLARIMLEDALSLATSVHGWNFAGRQAKRLAIIQDEAGEVDAAEQTMRRAIEYATRARDRQTLVSAYLYVGNRAGKAGDGVTALAYVREAARESMRAMISRGIHSRESEEHRALLLMAIQCARFKASATDAIAITESLKGVAMNVSLERGQVFAGDAEDMNRQNTITTLRAAQEQLRFQAVLNPGDIQIRHDIEIIDQKVKAAHNDAILRDSRYGRWCDANALDVSVGRDLHRKLAAVGPRATYFGFFRFGYDVWTYVCRAGEAFVPRRQAWPFGDADGDLRVGSRPTRLNETKIKQWSKLLIAPLAKQLLELRPEDPLIVSVDDGLMDIPLAALKLSGKRLCERATISVIHGIGMLEECVERETALKSVLCVGDPRRFDAERLPAAHNEIESISHQFRASGGKAHALLAERATVRALRELSPTVDVIHFACHAQGSAVKPSGDGPRLLLAIDASGHDSGHLSDERILAEITIKEGALVNLAACSSDEQGGGQGPIARGLVPAFLIKGASAVLSNLWALDDLTASRFNAMFYSLLLSGRRPAAALAETQRACIAGDLGDEMADPAAWAGYRLWGAR